MTYFTSLARAQRRNRWYRNEASFSSDTIIPPPMTIHITKLLYRAPAYCNHIKWLNADFKTSRERLLFGHRSLQKNILAL